MELVKPSIEYKDSFLEALIEDHAEGRKLDLNLEELKNDFEAYLKKLDNEAKGIGMKEGYVPATTFWLVDNNELVGRVSIRHSLNEHLLHVGGNIGYDIRPTKRQMGYGTKILELALPEAKKLGIDKVLITCDDENIGSAKIIEKNGGVLENKLQTEEGLKRRYWIEIK